MSVKIACPNCGQSSTIDDFNVGRTARCAACRTAFPALPVAPPGTTQSKPQMIGGRYQVSVELGHGAFGVAYRAVDTKLGKDVAIKMLLTEALASADAVRRFQLEADLLARLDHPNVVPILDKGVHNGCHYLVCKLVKGKTFAELFTAGGFRDPRQIVEYTVSLARTLHAVYAEHKILHRDVKPANMMLEKGHLYLMDFGMAACHDKNPLSETAGDEQGLATIAGTVVGTPAYMPPEQAVFQRDKIGPWSDVYSAGAVLYHFLTNALPVPWKGSVLDILTVAPVAPSHRRRELDAALDPILLKALAKDPARRYRTGDEFGAALQNWLDGSRTGSAAALPIPLPPAKQASPVVAPKRVVTGLPSTEAVDTKRASGTVRDEPAKRPSSPSRRDDEVEDEPEKRTPKSKSGVLLGVLLAVIAGAILLIGASVLVLTMSGGSKPSGPAPKSWI